MHRLSRILYLLPLLTLVACSTAFSGDVTPPENYQPPVTSQPAAVEPAAQAAQPVMISPANGWQIYNEYCALCHGNTGRGDGEHAARLSNTVPDLADTLYTRSAVPQAWYDLVSAGHPEQNMPAFMELLSESQRRDVTAYLFTLPITREDYEAGTAVYEENCSTCHAADGSGTADGVPDWTAQNALFTVSNQQIYDNLASSTVSAHAALDALDDNTLWLAAGYTRLLSLGTDLPDYFNVSAADAQQNTGSATAQSDSLTINGTVSLAEGELPASLSAVLLGYDVTGSEPVLELTSSLNPDGSYTFDDVPYVAERVYLVTVVYNDIRFSSDVMHAGDTAPGDVVDLPLVIYDSTSDTSSLTADRVHLFFDFSTPGKMQMVEMVVISNRGSKIVIPPAEGQPVITFTPPQGAVNLQIDDSGQPGMLQINSASLDYLAPIYPGMPAAQVLFGYELPYEKNRSVVNWVSPLPVTSAIIGFPAEGLKLSSEELVETGVRDMQGTAIKIFSGSDLEANQPLKLTISGKVPGAAGQNNLTAILIGAAGLLLAVTGVVIWFVRKRKDDAQAEDSPAVDETMGASEEELLDAIVALDDLYQSGNLARDVYSERRAALKQALQQVRSK